MTAHPFPYRIRESGAIILHNAWSEDHDINDDNTCWCNPDYEILAYIGEDDEGEIAIPYGNVVTHRCPL